MNEHYTMTETVQATDGRVDIMRQFVDVENEIVALSETRDRAIEQLDRASMRRRELAGALHDIIDGPQDKPIAVQR